MLPERFWQKVHIEEENPDACWVWTAAKNSQGYGHCTMNRLPVLAHRAAFMDAGGTLTEEKPLVLHRCNFTSCCNPNHLYAGDRFDNVRDSMRAGTYRHPYFGKTHCKRGHPLSGDNLSRACLAKGERVCLACQRIFDRRRREAACR